jgi:hypothetical protein
MVQKYRHPVFETNKSNVHTIEIGGYREHRNENEMLLKTEMLNMMENEDNIQKGDVI